MVKILIIDDESFMRDMIKKALKIARYSDIIEAANGKEGIKKFKEYKPDVVFLDLKLPDIYGGEVLKVFHKNKKINPKCKVIITNFLRIPRTKVRGFIRRLKSAVLFPYNKHYK